MWEFAGGCMRTYLALAEAARAVRRAARGARGAGGGRHGRARRGDRVGADDSPETLKAQAEQLDELAARGYGNERLDQLVVEVLLGVR